MFKRFLSDRSGNLAILGALSMIPIFGTAGLAIDVSHALKVKSELQAAADAAAVGSISEKSEGVTQAMAMTQDGTVSKSEKEALDIFAAQFSRSGIEDEKKQPGKESDLNLDSPVVTATVVKSGKDINAKLTFSLAVPTTFLKIIGQNSINVSGEAKAVYQANSFMDFYMLLDNTPSMGVGATPDDVEKLMEATANVADGASRNCAFACHIVSDDGVVDMTSNYFVARAVGAKIRIDVVAQAVAALTMEAEKQKTYPNQYRMAAYTFGQTAKDAKLFEVAKLTENLTDVKTNTSGITLMSIPYNNYNNDQTTSFDNALTLINAEIADPGDGSTTTTSEKILYFVADGVGDSYKPTDCTKRVTGGRCQEPIDIRYCQTLKDRGIKIAVLYTTYLPLDHWWYDDWIKPFQSEIGPRMEACASPGLYFEVSPTQGIAEAMTALFNKIIHTPRLTG